MKKPEDYFNNGEVYVWKETFAVAKSKKPLPDAVVTIQDKNEITVVIDQEKLEAHKDDLVETDRDWKIITFDMLLPLDMVGWIAKVSDILADEGISILILSAYSTDHVLVKMSDLEKATNKLKSMGCRISEK
ncbi:MAG: ACT domain-containing protein [bacterium]|nr:ACT domain-containing protein [bacterium]